MTTGTACWIFGDLSRTTYTDEEKLEAIYIVANMATHNAIKKSEIVSAIKWLLKEVRGWIPVDERLPESDQEQVLVCMKDSIDTAKYSPYSKRWYIGSMCSVSDLDELDVIAWMPCPKPYKSNQGLERRE